MASLEGKTSTNPPKRRQVVRTNLFMKSLSGIQRNRRNNLQITIATNNLNTEPAENEKRSENVIPEREVHIKSECTSSSNCRSSCENIFVVLPNKSEAHESHLISHETPINGSDRKSENKCVISHKAVINSSNKKNGSSCVTDYKTATNGGLDRRVVNKYDSKHFTNHGNYKLKEVRKEVQNSNKMNETDKVKSNHKHEIPFSKNVPNYCVEKAKTFPIEVCSSVTSSGSEGINNERYERQASVTSESSCSLISESPEFSSVEKEYLDSDKTESIDELDRTYTPEPEQIEAISEYLTKLEKEWVVSQKLCYRVESDLNRLFKYYLEGNRVRLYGSYHSGFAISTSDINIALQSDVAIRKSFMYEIYKTLIKEMNSVDYHVLPFEDTAPNKKSKILFTERSGIMCKLVYLGRNEKNVFQLGNLLKHICNSNALAKSLIIIVRVWAEECSINEAEVGRLHPIGFTLLAIHFLQQYKKCGTPLLPVIDKEMHCKYLEPTPTTDVSIGELWLEFLKYYGFTFNWALHIVTITDAKPVLKSLKSWEHFWMSIEDPYTGKNIAESVVSCDVSQYIQSRFRSFYSYFSHPYVDDFESSINECDTKRSESKKWHFSFTSCEIEEESISICEDCDDDYTCENCKSKFYQPAPTVTENFPDIPDRCIEIIDNSLHKVYEETALTKTMVQQRKEFVEDLEKYFQIILPGTNLELFGSSVNGFGFRKSDLDICLTIKGKLLEEINQSQLLWKLRCHLRKNRDFKNVYALFSAQIPIIKFWYTRKMWQGDISLYNLLAIHNSKLLCSYSLIDERCKILGCAMKMLAKIGCIADSSEKTLSSYSYLLMVIHYLQQTTPPVLPVLQDTKLCNMDLDVPYKMVDSWNVWFYSNIKNLDLESVEGKNKDSVGKLWVGLFNYYVKFDTNRIITIRQKEPMYVLEKQKLRIARLFNIEDPFILTRNLGCVLSDKKAHETMNVFRRARQLLGHPLEEFQTGIQDFKDFFFSTRNLTGHYVVEKECKLCGKVGHEKDNCTFFRPKFVPPRKLNMYKQKS